MLRTWKVSNLPKGRYKEKIWQKQLKNTKNTMDKTIETARENLLVERDRIDQEKVDIQARINQLRQIRVGKEKYNVAPLPVQTFKLSDVENCNAESSLTPEVITEKIWILERALKNDYMIDEAYRKAADIYVDAINETVTALSMESLEAYSKASEIVIKAKEEREQLIRDADKTIGEVRELFSYLGEPSFSASMDLSGPTVIKRFKRSLEEYK